MHCQLLSGEHHHLESCFHIWATHVAKWREATAWRVVFAYYIVNISLTTLYFISLIITKKDKGPLPALSAARLHVCRRITWSALPHRPSLSIITECSDFPGMGFLTFTVGVGGRLLISHIRHGGDILAGEIAVLDFFLEQISIPQLKTTPKY